MATREELLAEYTEVGYYAGTSRTPKFGEWMRGVAASTNNPIRLGMYVRTRKLQNQKCYELTDGQGKFWAFPASGTVFVGLNPMNAQILTCAECRSDFRPWVFEDGKFPIKETTWCKHCVESNDSLIIMLGSHEKREKSA